MVQNVIHKEYMVKVVIQFQFEKNGENRYTLVIIISPEKLAIIKYHHIHPIEPIRS